MLGMLRGTRILLIMLIILIMLRGTRILHIQDHLLFIIYLSFIAILGMLRGTRILQIQDCQWNHSISGCLF